MHDLPAFEDERAFDEFIVGFNRKRGRAFFHHQGADEIEEVARVKRAGVGCRAAGQISVANDGDAAIVAHHLVAHGLLTIAARGSR